MIHENEVSFDEIYKGIFTETAQQLFNVIRRPSYSANFTRFPELDNYILEHARSSGLTKDSPLNPGDVIEIQGPAVSGKTHFQYHLAAHCLLPKELDIPAKCTVHVGGWQSSVVVLDCDARWNLSRLHDILITRLNMVCGEENAPFVDMSAIALESLSRLHIFRPQSSTQLAATLENLPKYHMEEMPEEDIRFLIVDSISSFYWVDKWQLELSASLKAPSFRLNPQRHILRCLQSFKLSHAPIIVLANWGLYPTSSDASFDRPLDPFPEKVPRTLYPSLFDTLPRFVVPEEGLQVDIHIALYGAPKRNSEASNLRLEHTSPHEKPESFLKELGRKEDSDSTEIQGYVRMAPTNGGAVSSGKLFKFRILERDIIAV